MNERPRPGDDAQAPFSDGTHQRVIDTQVASLGAMVLGLFVLIKCYAAAKFSLTTASALLTTAPLTVLLGTLTSYDYQLFPLVGLASVCAAIALRKSGGWSLLCSVLVAVAAVAILLSPFVNLWKPSLALLGLVAAHQLISKYAHDDPPKRFAAIIRRGLPSLSQTISGFFVVAGLVMILATLTNLWLPVETVTIKAPGSETVVVGHVLSSESDWTVLVRATDRGLTHVRTDDVLRRKICHLSGAQPFGRRPLLYFLRGKLYSSPNISCQNAVDEVPGATLMDGSLP